MTTPFDDGEFDDFQEDDFEDAVANCHGHFEDDGVFYCGATGSEDCDECPFSRDIGLTAEQIEEQNEAEFTEKPL